MLLNIVLCKGKGKEDGGGEKGPVRACSLSPSKFKTGVRNKFLTPVNSPLLLIPITATIRTRQVFFVITVLFLNIVSVHEKGGVEIGEISYRNLVY